MFIAKYAPHPALAVGYRKGQPLRRFTRRIFRRRRMVPVARTLHRPSDRALGLPPGANPDGTLATYTANMRRLYAEVNRRMALPGNRELTGTARVLQFQYLKELVYDEMFRQPGRLTTFVDRGVMAAGSAIGSAIGNGISWVADRIGLTDFAESNRERDAEALAAARFARRSAAAMERRRAAYDASAAAVQNDRLNDAINGVIWDVKHGEL